MRGFNHWYMRVHAHQQFSFRKGHRAKKNLNTNDKQEKKGKENRRVCLRQKPYQKIVYEYICIRDTTKIYNIRVSEIRITLSLSLCCFFTFSFLLLLLLLNPCSISSFIWTAIALRENTPSYMNLYICWWKQVLGQTNWTESEIEQDIKKRGNKRIHYQNYVTLTIAFRCC